MKKTLYALLMVVIVLVAAAAYYYLFRDMAPAKKVYTEEEINSAIDAASDGSETSLLSEEDEARALRSLTAPGEINNQ